MRGGVSGAVAEAQEDVVEEPVIRSVEMAEEGGGEPTPRDGEESACDAPPRDALGAIWGQAHV